MAGSASEPFVQTHAGDLLMRAAAALCIEHLGARRLDVSPTGLATAAGNQLAIFFVPEIEVLVRLAHATLAAAGASPAIVAHPITRLPRASNGRGFPTDGHRLWAAGIPTASFITNPLCLFSWGNTTMPYFDGSLMRRQTIAFTRMLLALSATPVQALAYRRR
jgi:hypothetical protein